MSGGATRPPVLMIGLDAGDPELIERWTADGTLPHLAALRRRGLMGRLASPAKYLAGSPWPTMYTGRDVPSHGLYHDFQWRQEQMGFAAPDERWMNLAPFWRHLQDDVAVIACDMPFTPACTPFPGLEISGWASHDKLAPLSSHPPDLVSRARARFGDWQCSYEGFGHGTIDELLGLRDEMIENTQRTTRLAEWLLTFRWDLALLCFSATHRGGHRLWDRSSIAGGFSEQQGAEFDLALRDIYVACDAAVGRIVGRHPEARTLVYSTHGMMANASRADLLDDMLARVLAGGANAPRPVSALRRFGEALPSPLRRAVTQAVPHAWRNRLVTAWSAGAIDWSRTQAFCCRADLHGYVRINCRGREPQGIVSPGAEFDDLCERIATGLAAFRDVDTGEAIVEAVHRSDRVFPAGPYLERLPDLIVEWRATSAVPHRAVAAPGLGVVQRATPGRIPNGRSGNHRGEGFLLACGPGLPQGVTLSSAAHICDLAPTALALLQAGCRVPLAGKAIPGICEGTAARASLGAA